MQPVVHVDVCGFWLFPKLLQFFYLQYASSNNLFEGQRGWKMDAQKHISHSISYSLDNISVSQFHWSISYLTILYLTILYLTYTERFIYPWWNSLRSGSNLEVVKYNKFIENSHNKDSQKSLARKLNFLTRIHEVQIFKDHFQMLLWFQ